MILHAIQSFPGTPTHSPIPNCIDETYIHISLNCNNYRFLLHQIRSLIIYENMR